MKVEEVNHPKVPGERRAKAPHQEHAWYGLGTVRRQCFQTKVNGDKRTADEIRKVTVRSGC